MFDVKIKMSRSTSASDVDDQGCIVGPMSLQAGQEYPVSENLAKVLCDDLKIAVRVGAKPGPSENKNSGPSETKAEGFSAMTVKELKEHLLKMGCSEEELKGLKKKDDLLALVEEKSKSEEKAE